MRAHPGHGQGAQRPRPSTAPDKRLLVAAGLLLLLGSTALVLETARAFRPLDANRRSFPSGWLPGVPRVEELAAYLEKVDARVPMESFVAVDSQHVTGRDLHFLRMWCAYLLPRHRVVMRMTLPALAEEIAAEKAAAVPVYLLTYPARSQRPPGATEVLKPGVVSLHRLEDALQAAGGE